MFLLKYLLMTIGVAAFLAGVAVVAFDLYLAAQARRLLGEGSMEEVPSPKPARWDLAWKMAAAGLLPLLLGLSVVIVPSGSAGVRVSQISGTRPGTLYPGIHFVKPLIETVALFDIRD